MEGVRGGSTSRLIRVSHICRREVEQHQEEFGDLWLITMSILYAMLDRSLKGGLEVLVNLWRQIAVRSDLPVGYQLPDTDLVATTDIPHIRSDHARLLPAAPYLAAIPSKGKGTPRLQTATYLVVDFFEAVRDNFRWGAVLVLQRLRYLLARGSELRQADRSVVQLRDWGLCEDGGVCGRDVVSRAIAWDESVKRLSGVVKVSA